MDEGHENWHEDACTFNKTQHKHETIISSIETNSSTEPWVHALPQNRAFTRMQECNASSLALADEHSNGKPARVLAYARASR